MKPLLIVISALLFLSCKQETKSNNNIVYANIIDKQPLESHRNPNQKIIHVFVALCDNKYQGIVPVPKAIGNGQDAADNLYWGCDYGIKTFFKKSKEWQLLSSISNPKNLILERCIFK